MQKIKIPVGFFSEGAVVDVEYPYEDTEKSKRRPAVVVEMDNNKLVIVLLKISSKDKYRDKTKYPYAVEIMDIKSAGLTRESWVLTEKELILNGKNRLYLRGHLSELDFEAVKLVHRAAEANNSIVHLNYD